MIIDYAFQLATENTHKWQHTQMAITYIDFRVKHLVTLLK